MCNESPVTVTTADVLAVASAMKSRKIKPLDEIAVQLDLDADELREAAEQGLFPASRVENIWVAIEGEAASWWLRSLVMCPDLEVEGGPEQAGILREILLFALRPN